MLSRERSGSILECMFQDLAVASQASLRCDLEQDT